MYKRQSFPRLREKVPENTSASFPRLRGKVPKADGGVVSGEGANDYAALHRALIAGLPTQIGHRSDKGLFDGPRGRKFTSVSYTHLDVYKRQH